jgi:uncharacterized protein with HEPN domain
VIRSTRPRLEDIEQNITLALVFVHQRTLKHVTHDFALRYALQHALLIISEAVKNLPPELCAEHPEIPWRKIRSLGDKLRHEYHRINPEIIWDVATVHLKPLHEVIKLMLAHADQSKLHS